MEGSNPGVVLDGTACAQSVQNAGAMKTCSRLHEVAGMLGGSSSCLQDRVAACLDLLKLLSSKALVMQRKDVQRRMREEVRRVAHLCLPNTCTLHIVQESWAPACWLTLVHVTCDPRLEAVCIP